MRYLFFILFVAMFLPNFGTGGRTDYGTFELSDLIVGPYLLVAFLIARKRSGLLVDQALEVLVVFLAWALIGALFITFRYHYGTDYYERFSLLKLAKFALYCAAGVATAMALTNEWIQRRYHWALLAAGVTAASGLLFLPDLKGSSVAGEAIQAYKSSNGMSVLLSMLACYLLALWLAQTKSPLWRRCALPCMGLMFLGGAVSRGRGGWVAGLMGLAYLGRRYGINRRLATSAALAVALIAVAYAYVDVFRAQVNYTLFPDPEHEKEYNSGVFGIDDGERLSIFRDSVVHILDAPVYGTGFYHRGGDSGLYLSGSHNFFLQMFLETGLVGGALFLAFLFLLWRHAKSHMARAAGYEIPLKAALIAAIVGPMSGEYFYGGITLFALFALYAPCGALLRASSARLRASGTGLSSPVIRQSSPQMR